MAKTPQTRYAQELKRQEVNMAVKGGFGATETARRLPIPVDTLANWIALYRQNKQTFAAKPG